MFAYAEKMPALNTSGLSQSDIGASEYAADDHELQNEPHYSGIVCIAIPIVTSAVLWYGIIEGLSAIWSHL